MSDQFQSKNVDIDRHEVPAGMRFEISVDGASPEANARGLAVANALFKNADVSPYAAAWACFYMTMESEDRVLTAEEFEWATLFMDAEDLAIEAVCADMPKGTVVQYDFNLTWDGDTEAVQLGEIVRPTFVVGATLPTTRSG